MAYLDPTDDGTTGTTDTTVSDLWSWLYETQKKKNEANKFMTLDDGTTIRHQGQLALIFPDKEGKVTDNSWMLESTYVMRLRSMSVKDRKVFQQQLKNAGYLGPDYIANGLLDKDNAFIGAALGLARTVSAENYSTIMDPAALSSGKKPVSTDDYLKMMSGKKSGYSRTSVQTSVSSFSDAESRGILESFYGDALGRRPTDAEVAKFKKAINIAAKSNPTVSTTVSGVASTSTTNKEGYNQADAELSARKMAESQVGAAGYISSTKYMDAFLSVLGGKIGRV